MTAANASGAPAHAAIEVNPRARFEILGAILLALFLGALDQTIVGPVLPTIAKDLNGIDLYTWVVTAYLVTSTAAIPVYGKLSDLYGRKPMLIAGIVLFLAGSMLSGLSQTMWQLIAFRGLQGLGAGALFPISLAVIGDLFTPAERGKYQGLFGAVFGIAFLVGPAIGGLLTEQISWHWIFFVNVPIGFISLYLIGRLLPNVRTAGARFTLDVPGVVLLTLAVVPTLIALTLAETTSWVDGPVLAWFGVGLVSLIGFVIAEMRAEDPIIPLDLFKNRTFTVSAIATLFAIFGFSTLIIFLPLWFQIVKGSSPTSSGYALFPFLFGLIFSSILAGQLVSRTGRYKAILVVAMAMLTVGLFLFTGLRANTSDPVLWSWMLIAGLGVGPTMAIFTLIVQNDVDFHRLGTATSDLTLIRQIGTSLGLTVAFTFFRNNLTWPLIHDSIVDSGAPLQAVPATAPKGFDVGSLTAVGSTPADALAGVPKEFINFYISGFHEAFTLALAQAMWVGVGAAALAAVTVLLLKENPLRAHFHADQAARAGLAGAPAGTETAPAATTGSKAGPAPAAD